MRIYGTTYGRKYEKFQFDSLLWGSLTLVPINDTLTLRLITMVVNDTLTLRLITMVINADVQFPPVKS